MVEILEVASSKTANKLQIADPS